ncbi:MAG: carboxypeptidase regulatory-like domain-containing protein [Gemmatimonadaceae bacterium]
MRPIILAAVILVAGSRAGAQDVRIEVVDAATGKPIVGANVSLFDSAARFALGGGFSDQSGRIDVRAPSRGPYRLRADKMGYDTWTSVQLLLGDRPINVRAGMALTRTPISTVARSETACQQLGGPGTPAGDLWVELKKGLTASAVTEAQGLVPLDMDLYERVLDRDLAIISERAEARTRVARRPATGISWEQIDAERRGQSSSAEVYRAPDAATILSEPFVRSHCFAAIRGYGAESGLAGLEFKPSRVGTQPELTGVLWLDPKSNALRSLNFDYVNLPIPLRVARTSGRVEFQQLPGGQWIVPRWYIRMPRLARAVPSSGGATIASRDSLVGYQEVGGVARPAGAPNPRMANSAGGTARVASASRTSEPEDPDDAAASADQSVVSGIVYDSSSGAGLGGVQVSTGGGRFRAVTNSSGRYELAISGAIRDTIVFEHPRLRLLRIPSRVQSISLPAGGHAQVSVILPSYSSVRKQLCGQNEMGTEAQGLVGGYVKDAAGKPVARAHVWATWQILWVEQNGRLVSTNQQRTVETDSNSDGSYLMCGFTRGAQVTAKVSIAGRNTVQERLVLPTTMLLEHDFVIR